MSEYRECQDEIEFNVAVRHRQVSSAVWVVLRAVAVVMNEMRPREFALPLLDYIPIDVKTPIVTMVDGASCAPQKPSYIAAEIQNLSALPDRVFQNLVEVGELSCAGRDDITHKSARGTSNPFCPNDHNDTQ